MIKNEHILIKNIYYMLSYAFKALKQSTFEEVATEEFDNIHNLFAAILAKGIGQQLKQGLYREYINQHDDTPVVRGKIDLGSTIRNQISQKRIVSCEYDELSENNLLNQILKTTAILLIRSGQVKAEYKDVLKKEILFFSKVGMVDTASIPWKSIRFHRNNQTYQMLISLCQLIMEGMLLTEESGMKRLASFVDEQRMCHLYEKFILEYYHQEFPYINANASQIPWAVDDGYRDRLPIMQSDITLSKGSSVLIIDAKYYSHSTQMQYDKHTIHSNNLYQIFTYVKNKEASFDDKPHEVAGMLLYARTDEEIQPNNTYRLHGNRIDVKTLDLNCEFSVIREQLDQIANDFFGNGSANF